MYRLILYSLPNLPYPYTCTGLFFRVYRTFASHTHVQAYSLESTEPSLPIHMYRLILQSLPNLRFPYTCAGLFFRVYRTFPTHTHVRAYSLQSTERYSFDKSKSRRLVYKGLQSLELNFDQSADQTELFHFIERYVRQKNDAAAYYYLIEGFGRLIRLFLYVNILLYQTLKPLFTNEN